VFQELKGGGRRGRKLSKKKKEAVMPGLSTKRDGRKQ